MATVVDEPQDGRLLGQLLAQAGVAAIHHPNPGCAKSIRVEPTYRVTVAQRARPVTVGVASMPHRRGFRHSGGWGMVKTSQVFVSRTSDMAGFPPGRSFVQAVHDAVGRAGLAAV